MAKRLVLPTAIAVSLLFFACSDDAETGNGGEVGTENELVDAPRHVAIFSVLRRARNGWVARAADEEDVQQIRDLIVCTGLQPAPQDFSVITDQRGRIRIYFPAKSSDAFWFAVWAVRSVARCQLIPPALDLFEEHEGRLKAEILDSKRTADFPDGPSTFAVGENRWIPRVPDESDFDDYEAYVAKTAYWERSLVDKWAVASGFWTFCSAKLWEQQNKELTFVKNGGEYTPQIHLLTPDTKSGQKSVRVRLGDELRQMIDSEFEDGRNWLVLSVGDRVLTECRVSAPISEKVTLGPFRFSETATLVRQSIRGLPGRTRFALTGTFVER